MSKIEARLKELGLTLPEAGAPIANYVPFTVSGKIIYVSGQVPRKDGAIHPVGHLGAGVSIEGPRLRRSNASSRSWPTPRWRRAVTSIASRGCCALRAM